ncbi:unnamed protein product [Callosobruchus maculatus]|uniref:Osiris 11 n=1 Tax=Callosobruchus maculatus TaxID=64391 RepID=A0A653BGP6_CALMS|nr:unnamed protein product [Callosobruchus maculatus]
MSLQNSVLVYLSLIVVICEVKGEAPSGLKVIGRMFEQCATKDQLLKCFKVQALKVADRALRAKSLQVLEGVSLVANERISKSLQYRLNETTLEQLSEEQLDDLLGETSARFFDTHRLEVRLAQPSQEEARKKKHGHGQNHALYWALAIKSTFLAVAYKGIAVMSGMALMMGKMALLLTAILGLKKLVNHDKETTTFEIIKKPKYVESHSYSHEDEGYHHRSYEMQDRGIPKKVIRTYL